MFSDLSIKPIWIIVINRMTAQCNNPNNNYCPPELFAWSPKPVYNLTAFNLSERTRIFLVFRAHRCAIDRAEFRIRNDFQIFLHKIYTYVHVYDLHLFSDHYDFVVTRQNEIVLTRIFLHVQKRSTKSSFFSRLFQ